ncbi:MAG: tetratricopeptide repeat protein [Candidatus Marinimicrobia bacterium]|nr:tetratricopeptide repeat protein [Candidatus Neomarinimicrobiota bacterium]MDP7128060.1 tetratricopeptide repeat protein [Candidatus Neomarinimicrobiota bacterium]MDP7337257.1 tetratricopeptide repeat protein [Candidatus Neomarinimicrobiota bacterium]MDP7475394.1 tetratricopeptide repeat protein [Candidatus Neomarinimicrobiota bacterium]MDP7527560.1 tetratricopeptide repeat protein [Candidatus Neomarinimicrobiota bacterium]
MLKNNHYSSRKGLLLFITGIFLSVLILMPGSSLYAQQRMDDEVMPKEAGGQQEKVSEPINPTREVKEAAKFFYMQGVKKAKEKDYEGALEDLISAYKLFPDKKIKTQIDKLSSFLDKQTTPDIAEDGESSSAKKAPFIDKVASFFGRKTTPDIAEDGESSSAKKAPFIDKVASFLGIKPILLATGEKEAETYYREGLKKAKEKDYEGALEDLISAYKLFPDKKIKIQIDKLTSFLGTKPILFAQEGETLPEESDRSVRPEEKRPNAMKLAGEIFDITESLNSSRRQSEYMARNSDEHIYRKDIRSKSRFENDIRTLEKQLQVEPGNILLKRKLGLLYERKQDWDKAKVIYLDLIQQESYNPDNHFFLGSLYASLGDLDKARYLFEEALNLKPDHQPTLEAMYSYLDDTGDTKKMGKNFLKKSIRQNQSGPIQKMAIIREKLENELYDEAIGLAEAGLEQYPNHSGFLYLKGIGLEQNDEIEQARYSYQGAIQFDPKNQDIHLALANLYYNRGQFLYAALSFNDAVTLNPGDINSRYMQGLSYFNAGEWSRAVSAWESLLHYQKDHRFVKNLLPEAYYILAIEYNRTSEYSRSRYAFDNAMKINPNTDIWLPEALRILGKHYREQAMFRESFTAYQEVIELRPKDSGAYLGLGITYWAIGENMMARGAWEKSLELNPENNEAKGWLIVAQQGS